MLSHGSQDGNKPLAPPPARAPLDLMSVLVYTLREGRGKPVTYEEMTSRGVKLWDWDRQCRSDPLRSYRRAQPVPSFIDSCSTASLSPRLSVPQVTFHT